VSIVDSNVAWISGTRGTYAATGDGGETWRVGRVPTADSLEFRDVFAADESTVFLMSAGSGSDSRIYRTSDAGSSWQEVYRNVEPAGFFDCIDFWTPERGIVFSDAIDGDFLVLTTDDGGATWTRVAGDLLPDARDGEGAFAASGTCLLTGPGGMAWFATGASGVDTRVFSTSDFGETWEAAPTPIPSVGGSSGIFTLSFADEQTGLALGGDYVRTDTVLGFTAQTVDGGQTWKPAGNHGLTGAAYGSTYVPGAPTSTYVAVGPGGSSVSTDGGNAWTVFDPAEYWAVGAGPGLLVLAVGPSGTVARLASDHDVP
jgi:photosystem II stability/assembly factor-like uncharacterized protein